MGSLRNFLAHANNEQEKTASANYLNNEIVARYNNELLKMAAARIISDTQQNNMQKEAASAKALIPLLLLLGGGGAFAASKLFGGGESAKTPDPERAKTIRRALLGYDRNEPNPNLARRIAPGPKGEMMAELRRLWAEQGSTDSVLSMLKDLLWPEEDHGRPLSSVLGNLLGGKP